MSEVQEEKKKGKGILIILIVLVGLLTGFSAFSGYKAFLEAPDKIDTAERERDSHRNRADKLQEEIAKAEQLLAGIGIESLDSLQEGVAEIKANMEAQKEKIANLKKQIADLIAASEGDASDLETFKALYRKLKSEVFMMKSQIRSLQQRNQELIAENNRLKDENKQLGDDLDGERKNSAALSEERDRLEGKVNLGKKLQTFDVVAEGIKLRRNGDEKATTRAKRAEKIRVVFTVAKNEITDPGQKEIYLRVIQPDNTVLTDGGSNFDYKGGSLGYTSKELINYQNTSTDVYMYASNVFSDEFALGTYKIEIYCEEALIGVTSLTLK